MSFYSLQKRTSKPFVCFCSSRYKGSKRFRGDTLKKNPKILQETLKKKAKNQRQKNDAIWRHSLGFSHKIIAPFAQKMASNRVIFLPLIFSLFFSVFPAEFGGFFFSVSPRNLMEPSYLLLWTLMSISKLTLGIVWGGWYDFILQVWNKFVTYLSYNRKKTSYKQNL